MEINRFYYPSHARGEETRATILEALRREPHLSIAELSLSIGRCSRQVRRQLKRLRAENKVRKEGKHYRTVS